MEERRIPPRPWLSRMVAHALNPVNSLFDLLYHSAYNPFYRSGTLAIGLLLILLVTGFYLLFFYSVSAPYESMVSIQEDLWLGRWIRSLHRYATDAALIAVFFHVLQLLAQGKTWGPRTLAWISGVVLLAALFISAWTGYVMVWDQHGQLIARSGLELLMVLPFLRGEASSAFSGISPIPTSFFFMNLFLHVALPLGMLIGMWIHTARLARTVWRPIRPVFIWSGVSLTLLAICLPAQLLPKANLLKLLGVVPTDWWYAFWIPFIERTSAVTVAMAWFVFFLILTSLPYWWKPTSAKNLAISVVDEDGCTGCTQCVRDCPFEAIHMDPHPNGKHLLAVVSDLHCVSCGICTASCSTHAVGPPDRSAIIQQQHVEQFITGFPEELRPHAIAVVCCLHNDSVPTFLNVYAQQHEAVAIFPINCCATLHSDSLAYMLDSLAGVIIVGCAARNCMNRDGLDLLTGRIFGKRVPFLRKNLDRSRIVLASHSEFEKQEILAKIEGLQTVLNGTSNKLARKKSSGLSPYWAFKRTVATFVLVTLVGVGSQWPMGKPQTMGMLRITSRIPGQIKLNCRSPKEDEISALPLHMRVKEICDHKKVIHLLDVSSEGSDILKRQIIAPTLNSEIFHSHMEDIPLAVGEHYLHISLKQQYTDSSQNNKTTVKEVAAIAKRIQIAAGQIYLVTLDY